MLYRQLYQWSDPETLLKIYLSVIRPHLEYATPVWSPDLTKDVNRLEYVLKFALRVCTKEWSMSYKDLLEKCHCLPELSTRRDHLSLGLLHKIINGECILPNAPLLTYSTTYSTRSNVANRYILQLPFAHTNLLQGSYFHRTISLWNSLPSSITTTTSLPSFKRQLTHVH